MIFLRLTLSPKNIPIEVNGSWVFHRDSEIWPDDRWFVCTVTFVPGEACHGERYRPSAEMGKDEVITSHKG